MDDNPTNPNPTSFGQGSNILENSPTCMPKAGNDPKYLVVSEN